MKFRTLGMSGLRVSAVVLGCMGMSHAYGKPADKGEMMELLAETVDAESCSMAWSITWERATL